ncbi:MAG: hypothetical protein ACXVB9_00205 [Bdellovibrionota bacterium]
MKALLIAAVILLPASLAFADSDAKQPAAGETAQPKAVVPPVDTIEVTADSAPGLFERIRGAHIRAVKSGALASIK